MGRWYSRLGLHKLGPWPMFFMSRCIVQLSSTLAYEKTAEPLYLGEWKKHLAGDRGSWIQLITRVLFVEARCLP